MDEKIVARYMVALLKREGLTYETAAIKCNTSESTIKNLCLGKTSNPGVLTLQPIFKELNGSMDEMLELAEKIKNETKDNFENSIKELCEYQLKMNEAHINNIRTHYEQHRQDYMENTEKRLADKREIINQQNEYINTLKSDLAEQAKTLKRERNIAFIFAVVVASILVGLLILEVMNPNLGWLRF